MTYPSSSVCLYSLFSPVCPAFCMKSVTCLSWRLQGLYLPNGFGVSESPRQPRDTSAVPHPPAQTFISCHWRALFQGRDFEQPWFTVSIAPIQRPLYKLSFVPLTRLPAVWISSLTDSLTYAAPLNIYANVVRPPWKPQAVLLKRPPCTYKVKLGMSFSWEGGKDLKFKIWNLEMWNI